MSHIEEEIDRVLRIGKDQFVKELVSRFEKDIKKLSVLEIIKDHMELYPAYRNLSLMNKIRKMNVREARKTYVESYKKSLLKKNIITLIEEYI